MRVTTSLTDYSVGFDGLRAVVGAGEGVVGRFPGIVCVARCSDPAPLRELLGLCAAVGGPDPGRALARRLATWMSGSAAPGPELRFGTVAAAGDQLALFLVGAVEARVDTVGGLVLSGAHAAIGTDRLLPHLRTPIVLSLDGGPVRSDPADVHNLRAGVVPGAGVVLHPAAFDTDESDAEQGASLAGHEWFDTGDLAADPRSRPSWPPGVPAQRTGGHNGTAHAAVPASADDEVDGSLGTPIADGSERAPRPADPLSDPLGGDRGNGETRRGGSLNGDPPAFGGLAGGGQADDRLGAGPFDGGQADDRLGAGPFDGGQADDRLGAGPFDGRQADDRLGAGALDGRQADDPLRAGPFDGGQADDPQGAGPLDGMQAGDRPGTGPLEGGQLNGGPIDGAALADDPFGGDPLTGDPVGSDPLPGDPLAGDLLAGAPLADAPLADDPLAGAPLADDPLAGAPLANDPLAGDPLAGDPLAGDPLAGDSPAGDSLAGDPLNGNHTGRHALLASAGPALEDPEQDVAPLADDATADAAPAAQPDSASTAADMAQASGPALADAALADLELAEAALADPTPADSGADPARSDQQDADPAPGDLRRADATRADRARAGAESAGPSADNAGQDRSGDTHADQPEAADPFAWDAPPGRGARLLAPRPSADQAPRAEAGADLWAADRSSADPVDLFAAGPRTEARGAGPPPGASAPTEAHVADQASVGAQPSDTAPGGRPSPGSGSRSPRRPAAEAGRPETAANGLVQRTPSAAEATSTMPSLLFRAVSDTAAAIPAPESPDVGPTAFDTTAADLARSGARIRGYRCENGHLNDPRSPSCRTCGKTIDERAGGLVAGPRPALGRLVFDDGVAHLVDGGYLVGRMPEVDDRVRSGELRPIVVEDRAGSVSRVHAEVRVSGWDVIVVDIGSRNGTYVCGPNEDTWTALHPRRSRRLLPGTRVRLGARMFMFESSSTVR